MKTFKIVLFALLLGVTAFSCKKNQAEVKTVETAAQASLNPNATYAKAEFTIEGMTCAIGCAKTIEGKLAKMDGIKSAKVDFDKKLAMVEYDVAKIDPMLLEKTVATTGQEGTYKVLNMHNVESFSGEHKACNKKDCNKKNCTAKEKTACAKDCKKACCTKKA